MSVPRFRRIATAASFFAAGLLMLIGMALTPWEGSEDKRAYYEAMTANPLQFQIAPLFLHFGYAMLVPAVFGALSLLRGRGAVLGHMAAGLAVLGLSTLPGIIVTDWFQLALAETVGIEQAIIIDERAGSYPTVMVMIVPMIVGVVLALPILAVALWRAGVIPLAACLIVAVSWIFGGLLAPPTLLAMAGATAVTGVGLAWIGVAMLRTPDARWSTAPEVAPVNAA